jgi:hypothetical protein
MTTQVISGRKDTRREHFKYRWALKCSHQFIGMDIFSQLVRNRVDVISYNSIKLHLFQGKKDYLPVKESKAQSNYCLSILNSSEVIGHGSICFTNKRAIFRFSIHKAFGKNGYGRETAIAIMGLSVQNLLDKGDVTSVAFRYTEKCHSINNPRKDQFEIMGKMLLEMGFKIGVLPEHQDLKFWIFDL